MFERIRKSEQYQKAILYTGRFALALHAFFGSPLVDYGNDVEPIAEGWATAVNKTPEIETARCHLEGRCTKRISPECFDYPHHIALAEIDTIGEWFIVESVATGKTILACQTDVAEQRYDKPRLVGNGWVVEIPTAEFHRLLDTNGDGVRDARNVFRVYRVNNPARRSLNEENYSGRSFEDAGEIAATASGSIPHEPAEEAPQPIRTPEIVPATPSSAPPDESDESDDTDTFPKGVVGEECHIEIKNVEERSGQQVCRRIFEEGTFYVDPGKLNP